MFIYPEGGKQKPDSFIPVVPGWSLNVVGFELHKEENVSTPLEKFSSRTMISIKNFKMVIFFLKTENIF